MSSKTVKITNGKILNYKISAPNYKTIYGSQLITADGTITKNMIPDTSADGVYSLGDRIGNIATFVCYFNSTNPETLADQKYAVFVLDAKYRTRARYYNSGVVWGDVPANNNTVSGTYNTTYICSVNNVGNPPFFWDARNAATIILDGVTYQSQLPNIAETQAIFTNKSSLDEYDPTLGDYSNNSLSSWNMEGNSGSKVYTCNKGSYYYTIIINNSGGTDTISSGDSYQGVVPVFEIPVN